MQLYTPRDVGSTIRARRLAIRMTQNELATRVGVSRLWIGQTERGNPGASLDLILRTMAELGVVLTTPEDGSVSDVDASDRSPPVRGPDIGAFPDARETRPAVGDLVRGPDIGAFPDAARRR
jgi:HTH-type transcriptional regulator/antitoxin HipB